VHRRGGVHLARLPLHTPIASTRAPEHPSTRAARRRQRRLLANGRYQRVLHAKGVAASSGTTRKALDFRGAGATEMELPGWVEWG
jgi:hypothetical protein